MELLQIRGHSPAGPFRAVRSSEMTHQRAATLPEWFLILLAGAALSFQALYSFLYSDDDLSHYIRDCTIRSKCESNEDFFSSLLTAALSERTPSTYKGNTLIHSNNLCPFAHGVFILSKGRGIYESIQVQVCHHLQQSQLITELIIPIPSKIGQVNQNEGCFKNPLFRCPTNFWKEPHSIKN